MPPSLGVFENGDHVVWVRPRHGGPPIRTRAEFWYYKRPGTHGVVREDKPVTQAVIRIRTDSYLGTVIKLVRLSSLELSELSV